MLKNCEKYPLSLKMRIAGKNGHLSNDASENFAEKLIATGTKQIVLAHLSNYITSLLAEKGFNEGETFRIDVALTRPTTLFKLK